MTHVEHVPPVPTITGGFNTLTLGNHFIYCEMPQGDSHFTVPVYFRTFREIEDIDKTKQQLDFEYQEIGAFDHGIKYHLRTVPEQVRFMQMLQARHTVDVPVVLSYSQDQIVMEQIPDAVGLDTVVREADDESLERAVSNVLAGLQRAHSRGVVLGDRWCKNTLVTRDGGIVEIDFDLGLEGEHDKTSAFEIAQTLYHMVHFACDGDQRELLSDILQNLWQNSNLGESYNSSLIAEFIDRHVEFFGRKDLYEGIGPVKPDEIKHLFAIFR